MYRELIAYAKQNHLVGSANSKTVSLRTYIKLDTLGNYQGVLLDEEEVTGKNGKVKKKMKTVMVPDYGSACFGANQANFLVVPKGVLFRQDTKKKLSKQSNSYFYDLEHGSKESQSLATIWAFFQQMEIDDVLQEKVLQDLDDYGVKVEENISFSIQGNFVETMWDDWNGYFTKRLSELTKSSNGMCGISAFSGELQEMKADNLPSIKNVLDSQVKARFGVARASYFVAAKQDAYMSYGFDKALASRVGCEDMQLIVNAIESLLNDEKHRNLDFQTLYFYDNPNVGDIFGVSLTLSQVEDEKDDEFDDEESDDEENFNMQDVTVINQNVAQYLTDVLQTMKKKQHPYVPEEWRDVSCYMFGFRALASRCFMQNEQRISCYDLMQNLMKWYEDTSIHTGLHVKTLSSFYYILMRCVSNLNGKVHELVDKEFGELKYDLLNSIYLNRQIPELLYDRALKYAGNAFVTTSTNPVTEKAKQKTIPLVYVQLIKCYLRRKGYMIMEQLTNDTHVNKAYVCGQMFAVYEKLQFLYAERILNKTLAQSYFRAAMRQPGVVFPKLSEMAVVYLNGLKSMGMQLTFQEKLGKLSDLIGDVFPKTFNRDEQGSFILGYYQQKNALFQEAREMKLKKTEQSNNDTQVDNTVEEEENHGITE